MTAATAVARGWRRSPEVPAREILRFIIALTVFLASLLVLIEAPNFVGRVSLSLAAFILGPWAWMLSIGATEWGHVLALVALVVFLPGWNRSRIGRISAALAATAFALAVSPLARAVPVARSLPGELRSAFGEGAPRTMLDAPARVKPLVFQEIVAGVEMPAVTIGTATYQVRDGKPLLMDLYRPLRMPPTRLPVVIMIHGGSWRGGSRRTLAALNRYLASRGYAVAAISYSLAPDYPHPAASQDVQAAIDFLKSNASRLGLDASRIALIGRSAGGQLALLAAYRSGDDPAIRGVVGLYAPTDQVFGYEHPSNARVLNSTAVLEAFLVGNPRTAHEAYVSSSPINFVGPSTPPTLLIHGEHDELVSVRQSERLDQRLTTARRPHLFLRFPWATHGCDYNFSGPCGQLSTYAIERFLAAVIK